MIIEICLLVALIYLILQLDKKPKGLPPGPWGLPIIGHLTSSGLLTLEDIKELKKKHGNIFGVRTGSLFFVFLTDFDTIKSAFNSPDLQNRPAMFALKALSYFQNLGLGDSEGEVWSRNRRFALRQLRDLGLGKTRMQISIQNEAQELVSFIEKQNGQPIAMGFEVNVAILNVIWQLVASKRYDLHDQQMKDFTEMANGILELIQGPPVILSVFPWLLKLLPTFLLNKLFKVDLLLKNRDDLYAFIQKVIDEHVEKLDPNNVDDFIDCYLSEMAKGETSNDPTGDDMYKDLRVSIADLFSAGSETTASTLRWFVLLMATHPEIQEKARAEIDKIVPRSRQPSLEDKKELIYFGAILQETLRFSSFAVQGVPHAASVDTKIGNYDIPKGTSIIACHEYCHYSKEYFEQPDKFYPEHFIGEDGELLTKKHGFAPFSIGRRQCLGESLAKNEFFIFASIILQNFTITPHPDHPLDLSFDKSKLMFNFAKPYKVCFNKRNSESSTN